ncbi:hypothetical protein KKE06_03680 [Candidatus Micrarchaeota archaeon]|nr:hypothetical protein [Candidatus Micrarchaeota archaeon]MBU1930435.1 hypothetical protein [Candidatus Micrarchaeota archaeon]
MKDLLRIVIGFCVVAAVLGTLCVYALHAAPIEFGEILLIAVILIIVVGAAAIVWQRTKDAKKGLPTEDERSLKTAYKAGYYAFIVAIWSAVGVNWIDIFITEELGGTALTLSQGTGVVVLLSGLVFIIGYLWLNKRTS